ncbi:LOW QUALITY PROTEIN: adherens junction-associated protein 1 [Manacus vitellinus]|uniref:LOW QUALITY PROTEIN: adherens junction-associated protein 1 n=1 Tax=Manacus vitellinus TaxID=328815 RepID=UPI00115D6AC4|nr:LOW QUALITY PROTEIN: adherens junction-associated protein 1 [Manacus vitellinus]
MDLDQLPAPAPAPGGALRLRALPAPDCPRGSLWGAGFGEGMRRPGPPGPCAPAPPAEPRSRRARTFTAPLPPVTPCARPRSREGAGRHLRAAASPRGDGRPQLLPEVIVWAPRAERDSLESSTWPGAFATAAATTPPRAPRPPHHTAARHPATPTPARVPQHPGTPPGGTCPAAAPAAPARETGRPGHSSGGKDARPPRGLGDSTGLAVHQIITITVSLIMVIAALITTLVLKNCCAQSGRPRRNSHQRKLDQQEESCQNLTDFAPARVPSALDIFTAYNETLQCSHECVRTPVSVYAEDTLHSPGDYKTTFNGNRPSSSDRHLIPVAFVSEKWFEISC